MLVNSIRFGILRLVDIPSSSSSKRASIRRVRDSRGGVSKQCAGSSLLYLAEPVCSKQSGCGGGVSVAAFTELSYCAGQRII